MNLTNLYCEKAQNEHYPVNSYDDDGYSDSVSAKPTNLMEWNTCISLVQRIYIISDKGQIRVSFSR